MSVSSIGIQMIEPKTATSSKSPPPPIGDRDDAVIASVTLDAAVKRSPPPAPPGMGKLVDRQA
jgi:hypothetical protein